MGGNLPEVTLAKKQGQEVTQDSVSVNPGLAASAAQAKGCPPGGACSSCPHPSSAPAAAPGQSEGPWGAGRHPNGFAVRGDALPPALTCPL